MTPEERLDRLERIAKLFVKAGLRARTNIRKQHENILDQHEKINMLITLTIDMKISSITALLGTKSGLRGTKSGLLGTKSGSSERNWQLIG